MSSAHDMEDLPALPAAAAEDKALLKEKAVISKKLKHNQRMYSSLVNLLAKCRSSILLGEVDAACTPLLNTLEKECQQFHAKAEDDLSLEDIEERLAGIGAVTARLHRGFPHLAPKSKKAKVARVGSADMADVTPGMHEGGAAVDAGQVDGVLADGAGQVDGPPAVGADQVPACSMHLQMLMQLLILSKRLQQGMQTHRCCIGPSGVSLHWLIAACRFPKLALLIAILTYPRHSIHKDLD